MRLTVDVDVLGVQGVADALGQLTTSQLNAAALPVVNTVAARWFDESRRRMISRVNLTDDYVKQRMDVESANDAKKPEAKIIAFRAGGRRPGLRPVNLRQYGAVAVQQVNNWSNSGVSTTSGRKIFTPQQLPAYGPVYRNPRKPSGLLPFKPRIGDTQQNIPVGRKSAGVSVEVLRGSRKTLENAFMRRMPNGQILVMGRKKGSEGKGKIEALYSLSVWQLFRRTAAVVVPFVRQDLERGLGEAVSEELKRALG